MKDRFIPSHLKPCMKTIIRKAGISSGNPSDRTLMNRFYQAKEKILALRKRYEDVDGNTWHAVDPGVSYEDALKALDVYVDSINEIEHQLLEHELLEE